MSEQLETIKCADWTINFSWAVGGVLGGVCGRSHDTEQVCLPLEAKMFSLTPLVTFSLNVC